MMGDFVPAYPTSGYFGDIDRMCQPDGSCLGTLPRSSTLHFPRPFNVMTGSEDFVFTSDGHGTWQQGPRGDSGDITGCAEAGVGSHEQHVSRRPCAQIRITPGASLRRV